MPTIIPSGTGFLGSGIGPVETIISISPPAIATSTTLIPAAGADGIVTTETLISGVSRAVATTTVFLPINNPAFQTITTLLTILREDSPTGGGVVSDGNGGVDTNVAGVGTGFPVLTTYVVTSVFAIAPTQSTATLPITVTTDAPVGFGFGSDPSNIQSGIVPAGTDIPIVTGKAAKTEITFLTGLIILIAAFL